MARPLTFDPAQTRNAALARFWRDGYQATSLSDLTDAMGISRSSFYAAFGDKRALFVECIDTFAVQTLALIDRLAAAHAPADALRRFLLMGADSVSPGQAGWGCLLVNTSLETAGFDAGLRDRASAHLGAVEARLSALLGTAGLPRAAADAHARYLMTVVAGLRVAARRGETAEKRSAIVTTALRPVLADLATLPGGTVS
jgi:TetR/AcrR family transcriptional repressor of nem operon